MKKYYGFSVDVVANGFIASIGCKRLVFKTMEEVSEAIMDYAKDPEGASRKMLDNSFISILDLPPAPDPALSKPRLEVTAERAEMPESSANRPRCRREGG